MKSFIFFVVIVAVSRASCPGSCNGHGKCGEYDKCSCFARWVGNDCSQRQCPFGLSWVATADNADAPAGGTLGGQHEYTTCSSRGLCSADSGECECFPGYTGRACSRTTCPNDCSGHGRCLYNEQIGYTEDRYVQFNSQFWDAAKTRQCACDRGYSGVDCSSRMCPKGDDPLTDCSRNGDNTGISKNDKQTISVEDPPSGTSYFTLTFQDMYNGKYTTRPIEMTHGTAADHVATAKDAKSSLEELPNFAIPNVTVTFGAVCDGACSETQYTTEVACTDADETWSCTCTGSANDGSLCSDVTDDDLDTSYACDAKTGCTYNDGSTTSFLFTIEFVDAANSGKQNTLVVNKEDHNTANYQPRKPSNDATFEVEHTAVDAPDAYKEGTECSNRGVCDSDSGLCECFEGYAGEACSDQTVFF